MNILAIRRYLSNFPGWRTNRKFLVVESDDWGSIRMPSLNDRNQLREKGVVGAVNRYNRYDTLANSSDLCELFEVLSRHKDREGRSVVFTTVTITGNPDFERIKKDDFQQYYYEPFTKTLSRYYDNGDSIIDAWKQGIKENLFKPQFHGREHLNVAEWMRALQNNDKITHLAFEHGFWGFDLDKSKVNTIDSFQAAFDLWDTKDLKVHAASIKEGLQLFETLFGYKASFFVPPNGPFNNILEQTAWDNGIKFMSKSKIQLEPLGNGKSRKVYHRLGQQNELGQTYLTRNCVFEPSEEGKDWVDSCLNDIKIAFRMRKPAVISTHRVNYIGALEVKNRSRGLEQLDALLGAVTKKWPEVEFISSDELGEIIVNDQ